MSEEPPRSMTATWPSPGAPSIRLLLSGGGFRGMIGGVGVMLTLIELGRWSSVREIVSVSGGGPPSAALLASAGGESSDSAALAAYYRRVVDDRSKPHASLRRLFLVAVLVVVLIAVPVLVWSIARWSLLVGLLAATIAVPGAIQVGRVIVAAYFRDTFRATVVSAGQRLSDVHDENASRQHVFCATGLSSGSPYHLWVGGAALFAPDPVPVVDADVRGDDAGPSRWGVEIAPGRAGDLTIEDAVMASASLPLVGAVMSPAMPPEARRSGVGSLPERLVDGGASGVFGLQVAEAGRSRVEITRSAGRTADQPVEVIAVDAFRHRSAGEGLGARCASFVRDRVSSLLFLIDSVKVFGEALYVNDLSDTLGMHLVRLCSPDLDPLATAVDDESSWRHDWGELVQRRTKSQATSEPREHSRSPIERLGELRGRTAQIGLFGLNDERAETVMTTAVVATYLALSPVYRSDELLDLLRRVGIRLDAHGRDECVRSDRLVERWQRTAVPPERRRDGDD